MDLHDLKKALQITDKSDQKMVTLPPPDKPEPE